MRLRAILTGRTQSFSTAYASSHSSLAIISSVATHTSGTSTVQGCGSAPLP
jgi:hypothetical protein